MQPEPWTGSGQVCWDLWSDKEEASRIYTVGEVAAVSSNLESYKIQASVVDSAYKIYRQACTANGH